MKVYVYNAALLCAECVDRDWITTLEPDGTASGAFGPLRMPQGPYPDGGGEADTPQHCDTCNEFLENPLTDDGREYVRAEIALYDGPLARPSMQHWANWRDDNAINVWREFYEIG
jgi:hypothetical protein